MLVVATGAVSAIAGALLPGPQNGRHSCRHR